MLVRNGLKVSLVIMGLMISLFPEVSMAAPAEPNELQAMQWLYGPAYVKTGSVVKTPDPHGIRVNKGPGYDNTITEYVRPWQTATVNLNGKTYFIATGQGSAVTNSENPSFTVQAQPAYISAIWFQLDGNHWVPVGREYNFAAEGSNGRVNGRPWSIFPQRALLKNQVLLVGEEDGFETQGYASSWYPIYTFNGNALKYLGGLSSGGSNGGAGVTPVISIQGKIIAAALSSDGQPHIILSFNGNTVIQGKAIQLHNTQCKFISEKNSRGVNRNVFKPTTQLCMEIVKSVNF